MRGDYAVKPEGLSPTFMQCVTSQRLTVDRLVTSLSARLKIAKRPLIYTIVS